MPIETNGGSPRRASATTVSVKAANSGTLWIILTCYRRFELPPCLLLDQPLVLHFVECKGDTQCFFEVSDCLLWEYLEAIDRNQLAHCADEVHKENHLFVQGSLQSDVSWRPPSIVVSSLLR